MFSRRSLRLGGAFSSANSNFVSLCLRGELVCLNSSHKEAKMRFMFLNHSYKHHSPELEAHILKLLKSYASPDTTFELAYPEDLGGGEVLSLLEERKGLWFMNLII
jgi:hypothetical protein